MNHDGSLQNLRRANWQQKTVYADRGFSLNFTRVGTVSLGVFGDYMILIVAYSQEYQQVSEQLTKLLRFCNSLKLRTLSGGRAVKSRSPGVVRLEHMSNAVSLLKRLS